MATRSLRFFALAFMLSASAVHASEGGAEQDATERARAFVSKAMEAASQGDHVASSEAWAEVVRLRPSPAVIFNYAQSLRMAERYADSKEQYERYLEESPNARNRAEVEALIAEVSELVEERTVASDPPPPEVEPEPAVADTKPWTEEPVPPTSWESPFWLKATLVAVTGALLVGSVATYGVSRRNAALIDGLDPDREGVAEARRVVDREEMTAIGLGGAAAITGAGAIVAFTF